MSRDLYKFWLFVVVLVMRLALGESVHAMPHAADAAASDATIECSEHDGTELPSSPSSESECCQYGSCECPCFHTPCMTQVNVRPVALISTGAHSTIDIPFLGLDRPFDLLRPPA